MRKRAEQKVICLTPVRNEAWILPAFLKAASIWADEIIISDQGSTDGSVEIARSFPKVVVVSNPSVRYSETDRQSLLLAKSRENAGTRVLVPLDADEFLSPELTTVRWFDDLVRTGIGAYTHVPFFNLKPGLQEGWTSHTHSIAAWVDNGAAHVSTQIHSRRLPLSDARAPVPAPPGAKVIHFQFTAPARMRSKHRWYAAWERLYNPERSAIRIYRQYHHMDSVPARSLEPVPPAWLTWYSERGVPLDTIVDDGNHWWDAEVLAWIAENGAQRFAREAIWSHDWVAAAVSRGIPEPGRFADPRTAGQKKIHAWLKATQPRSRSMLVRCVDRLIAHYF